MKFHWNITRCISRDMVRLLDEDGVKRRKQRRLRRRQYFSKGPNFVWHLDGYDKLKPYGISIHGCIDGFSRRLIWLNADITNKRPEVIAEYYLNAVYDLEGCPQRLRADPGTENGIISTFHAFLIGNSNAVTLGSSTSNQIMHTVCIPTHHKERYQRAHGFMEQPRNSKTKIRRYYPRNPRSAVSKSRNSWFISTCACD
ncbi:uncharacterized protein LOC134244221 isoform X3 [Saccostrea cucullata]|uniref:uncharacterized protein LOC134244221 isoform X3 n=1 Tax=Saccostrea cuccullata TaxID=36930 RepID=UPI002ED25362